MLKSVGHILGEGKNSFSVDIKNGRVFLWALWPNKSAEADLLRILPSSTTEPDMEVDCPMTQYTAGPRRRRSGFTA